jgi:hypothetical protein
MLFRISPFQQMLFKNAIQMPFRNATFKEMLFRNAPFQQMLFKNANRMPFRNAIFKEMLLTNAAFHQMLFQIAFKNDLRPSLFKNAIQKCRFERNTFLERLHSKMLSLQEKTRFHFHRVSCCRSPLHHPSRKRK